VGATNIERSPRAENRNNNVRGLIMKLGRIWVVFFMLCGLYGAPATASIADDLMAGQASWCGTNPTRTCALEFWNSAKIYYTTLIDPMEEFYNSENWGEFCTMAPTECNLFMLDLNLYMAARNYIQAKINWWESQPVP
jgi:hypothetical protein